MTSTSGMRSTRAISAPSNTHATFVIWALLARTGPATAKQHAMGRNSLPPPFSAVTSLRNFSMMKVSEVNF